MTELLHLTVRAMALEAVGIVSLELVHPVGRDLPPFTPGAHLDVQIRPGLTRSYSLCNDPRERHRYVIAVLHAANTRGGSRAMHESVRVGQALSVTKPQNHFPLSSAASRHLLLAGGIGVTPLLAMVEHLQATGQEFVLHYCTREPARTAFRSRIAALAGTGRAVLHHDGGRVAEGLDIPTLLKHQPSGTHLYYCGPPGFMEAVKQASSHWRDGTVHFEYFEPPTVASTTAASEFNVVVASTGISYPVAANENIVDVLRREGVAIETSCDAGVCGTCKTRYLRGEAIHNDFVLTDAEHAEWMTPCCSRARGSLVLDV